MTIPRIGKKLCIYEGEVSEYCKTCSGTKAEDRHVRYCMHPSPSDIDRDFCTRGVVNDKVQSCSNCPDFTTTQITLSNTLEPDSITKIKSDLLVGSERKFNCSLIEFNSKTLLCYRINWFNSKLYIAELDSSLQPLGSTPLELNHPKCSGGCEDPRFFTYRGKLHVSFTGLSYQPGKVAKISVLVARLNSRLQAEKIYEPEYSRRSVVEKNWAFFETPNHNLHAIYSIKPHRVLRINAETARAEDAFETTHPMRFNIKDEFRGGASPTLHNNEFYNWFHGRKFDGKRYSYWVGLYTFAVEPPFRIKRFVNRSVWTPDPTQDKLNVTQDKNVIYPCGAIVRGTDWLVSAGHQDHHCVIAKFDTNKIESALINA